MDSKVERRGPKGDEKLMSEKLKSNGAGQVVITISNGETPKTLRDNQTPKGFASREPETVTSRQVRPESPGKDLNAGGFAQSIPPAETSRMHPSTNKPPKIPTSNEILIRRSLSRSVYSKPKSRFGEPVFVTDDAIIEEEEQIARSFRNSLSRISLNNKSASSMRINSISGKTPSMTSSRGQADDDEEEIYRTVELSKEKQGKLNVRLLIQWVAFFCILGCLVASLTVEKLEKKMVWGMELWKWCVLVMVSFSGMLITNWFMHFIVFLIERNFLLRKKVLYFVHGLKKSVQVFIWLVTVLVAWVLVFDHGVERSKNATKILKFIRWTLVSILIGSFLFLLKTLALKILASSFHVNRFFDRIQESVFHQYVLQTLSGPPLTEEAEKIGRIPSTGHLSFRNTKKGKEKKDIKVIDMGTVHRMKQEKVSAWTMKVLVDAVTKSGLSTISNTLDESVAGGEQTDQQITNESEATIAAYRIFQNVARPGQRYIEEDDLLRFMIKEEVDLFFPLIEGYETGRISRKALTEWVVKVYTGRKALAHSLDDTKTAVRQLDKLIAVVLIVVNIIIWVLLMDLATPKVLGVIGTQIVLIAFMFGNTTKTVFESIIFVFFMHPFDVGDRCVVDGVPLLVEEMNIFTTVFLKLDFEKVYYPNSVLATKVISNYFRSPNMGDAVNFSIDFGTPVDKIGLLKEKIKHYLENTPQHWHPGHTVVVKEIENVNKLQMALYCLHTMNFQDIGEKTNRRTELVMELKRIMEEIGIKYYLLPQQIHLQDNRSEIRHI